MTATRPTKSEVRPHIVLVLGMHRSGTSALTRGLEVLGIDLGTKLSASEDYNKKGLFEDTDVVILNERVLERAQRSWHSLEPIEPSLLEGPEFFDLRNEATNLLNRRLRSHPLYGLKDPRLCVLMPFWRCVMENMSVDVSYVLALRNPLAVAQSLHLRDGMSLERGAALWGNYMLHALRGSESGPRVFVNFDSLLARPLREINRIADGLKMPRVVETDPKFTAYVDDFLELELRHHSLGDKELRRSGRVLGLVADLYEQLSAAVAEVDSDDTGNTQIEFGDFSSRLHDIHPLLRALDTAEAEKTSLNSHNFDLALRAEALEAKRRDVQVAHDAACEQRDEALERNEALDKRITDLDEQLKTVIEAHEEACRQRDQALEQNEALDKRTSTLDEQLKSVFAAHDEACRQRDGALQQSQLLERRASDLDSQRRSLQAAHDAACQQHDDSLTQNELLANRVSDLDAQLSNVGTAHDEACRQRDAALKQNESLSERATDLDAQLRTVFAAHQDACRQRDEALKHNEALNKRANDLDAQRRSVQAAHDEACRQRDEALDELKRRLDSFETSQQAQLRLRNQLEADLAGLSEQVSALQLERSALKAKLTQQDGAFKAIQCEYDAETGVLRDQLASEVSRREDIGALLARDRSDFEQRTLEWEKERQTLNASLSQQISLKDALEADLSSRIDALEASLATEADRVVELTAEKESLNLHLKSVEGTVRALRAQLQDAAEQQRQAEANEKALSGRTEVLVSSSHHQLETIRHLQDQLQKKQNEVRAYTTSTSWKITAPLRGLSRFVTGSGKAENSPPVQQTPAPVAATIWKSALRNGALEAPRPPPAEKPQLRAERGSAPDSPTWIGIVIHVFYPEMLEEILSRLGRTDIPAKLYVTTPRHAVDAVRAGLEGQPRSFMLFQTDNRGRDMAPFLVCLGALMQDGAPLLLKVHTKSSTHLSNGVRWRQHLFDTLLANGAPDRAIAAFSEDSALGLLAPDGHVLAFGDFLGKNEETVTLLMQRLGMEDSAGEDVSFVAGSMFYARPSIFESLVRSGLSADEFELERGQIDGTLAHAMERLVGFLVKRSGLRLAELSAPNAPVKPLGSDMYPFV